MLNVYSSSTSSACAKPKSLIGAPRDLGLGRPACDTTTSTSTLAFKVYEVFIGPFGSTMRLATQSIPCTFRVFFTLNVHGNCYHERRRGQNRARLHVILTPKRPLFSLPTIAGLRQNYKLLPCLGFYIFKRRSYLYERTAALSTL